MKYVFGPVPSRRLGRSLGVDPIPFKTCNWSCVYCQLGRTSPMTVGRGVYHPVDAIVREVQEALHADREGAIDWITFVGSGEPTLHSELGKMIRQVKDLTAIPVAVLTNGSLLYQSDVREELLAADAVLPSVDAGSEHLYRKINRPAQTLTFDRLIRGLVAFRRAYTGKLWVEVMLLKGVNDTPEALAKLAAVLREISPDEVHVSLPMRPPAESWVEPPDDAGFMRAIEVLGQVAHVVQPVEGTFDISGYDNVVDAVIGIIARHPMREEELVQSLDRWHPGQVADALEELAASGRARVVERLGRRFWSYADAHYADQARCTHDDRSCVEPAGPQDDTENNQR